jgi:tRNA-2-methylthio-N6-dimethylallyladenosine synthase
MIRRYTCAEYIERAERLRAARPGMTLSTDIIVGFPGETEPDFRATLDLVRTVGFTSLFGFKFSPRPLTPALKLADDVPEEVKSERLARLFELAEAQTRSHLASLVGTKQRVLVEGRSKGAGKSFEGRTERNEIVHVERAPEGCVGRVLEVEIVQSFKHSLLGLPTEPVRCSTATAPALAPKRALPLVAP